MGVLDRELIELYFNLENKIKRVIQHKADLIHHYHETPFLHSNWNFDSNGDKIPYPSMEMLVVKYVDTSAQYDALLASLYYRAEVFNKWLKTLTEQNRDDLKHGTDMALDFRALNAINKIEKQIPVNYRFEH